MQLFMIILLSATLIICTVSDVRSKQIYTIVPLAALFLLVILMLVSKQLGIDNLLGALIGAGLMLLSLVAPASIGFGDGLLFLLCGLYLGFWRTIILLFISCILSIVVILPLKGRKAFHTEMPFIPFIFSGWILLFILPV